MAVNWEQVDRLAQAHVQIDPTASEEDLLRRLRLWWCLRYTRPFLDPLLDTYTLDDLIYEYLIVHYLDPENNPGEKKKKDDQVKDDMEWARSMLQKVHKPDEKKADLPSVPDLPEISTKFKE